MFHVERLKLDCYYKYILYMYVYCPASQEWQWRRVLFTIVN